MNEQKTVRPNAPPEPSIYEQLYNYLYDYLYDYHFGRITFLECVRLPW